MGQALYRKYRPKSFSDTVGQDAIVSALFEAIKSGRLSHAYLFAGPKGVGKTSVARILAHEINKLPYQDDSPHLDIIEIDAASNRRIDEIRDLREKVHVSPTSAKYKVYIIDEVHMLTKEAFNALLKTLEEPPAHTVFILATTEPHKLPETITSRTQRFNFKPISHQATKSRLKKIAKAEKIQIDNDGVEILTEFSDGSLRDVISLLDQLALSGKKINESDIRNLLGLPPKLQIEALISSIAEGEPAASLRHLINLTETGANPVTIAKAISLNLRTKIASAEPDVRWMISLLKDLLEVSASSQPNESLELAVLSAASTNASNTYLLPKEYTSGTNPAPTKLAEDLPPPAEKKLIKKHRSKDVSFDLKKWPEVLGRVKNKAPRLYTALRLANPTVEDNELTLAFNFPLHQKKMKEAKNLKLVSDLIQDVSGAKVVLHCIVDKNLPVSEAKAKTTHNPADVEAISSIFGSAEMLES